ncbi:MAG: transporter [Elusimicrobia bacterium]|nr:transporter [Elusimicrobiota bacterium]
MHRTPTIAVILLAALAASAAAKDWRFGAGAAYDSGKYGTGIRTDSVSLPFTLTRYYHFGEVSATAAWLRQSSKGRVTRVWGLPARLPATRGPSSAESGPGDILVRGTLALKTEKEDAFDLALVGRLKLPTADKDKGLGTGQLDQGAGLEFSKDIAGRWTLLLNGYYTIIGDPRNFNFNNELALAAGFRKRLNEVLSLEGLYETRSALVDGTDDPRDLRGLLTYTKADGDVLSAGLLLGLSEGSPSVGLSFGFSRRL